MTRAILFPGQSVYVTTGCGNPDFTDIQTAIDTVCDDAFIAFRYVSNLHDGHGLVWNRAPFQPVEGYTSFLWVVLLHGAWSVFGVEPPQSANWISLLFTYLEVMIGVLLILRGRWSDGARRWFGKRAGSSESPSVSVENRRRSRMSSTATT